MSSKIVPAWVKDGAPVWFQPIVGARHPRYAGVVDGDPFRLGGDWCVNLRQMEPGYRNGRGRVVAAYLGALRWRRVETPAAGGGS